MAEKYEFIDINAAGPGIVAKAFDNQVAYCTASGATITARIVAALRDLVESDRPGTLLEKLRTWRRGHPRAASGWYRTAACRNLCRAGWPRRCGNRRRGD